MSNSRPGHLRFPVVTKKFLLRLEIMRSVPRSEMKLPDSNEMSCRPVHTTCSLSESDDTSYIPSWTASRLIQKKYGEGEAALSILFRAQKLFLKINEVIHPLRKSIISVSFLPLTGKLTWPIESLYGSREFQK